MNWKTKFAKETEREKVKMTLIGGWSDLCAYYSGSDGNCWSYHMAPMGWSNNGPVEQFKERIKAGKFRGELNEANAAQLLDDDAQLCKIVRCGVCNRRIKKGLTWCPICGANDADE